MSDLDYYDQEAAQLAELVDPLEDVTDEDPALTPLEEELRALAFSGSPEDRAYVRDMDPFGDVTGDIW